MPSHRAILQRQGWTPSDQGTATGSDVVVTDPRFGAKPGEDCTAALQRAHDEIQRSGVPGMIILPRGTYHISATLEIDVALVGIRGDRAEIRASHAGIAIHAYSTAPIDPDGQATCTIEGIELIGPGLGEAGSIGLKLGALNGPGDNNGPAHIKYERLDISDFETGISLADHTWLTHFIGCNIWKNGTGVHITNATEVGEQIHFTGCAIYGGTKGVFVESSIATVNFYGCAFDYIQGIAIEVANARAYCYGCHFEWNQITDELIKCAGGFGTVAIHGGWWVFSAASAAGPAWVNCTANKGAGVIMRDVAVSALYRPANFFTGSGRLYITGTVMHDNEWLTQVDGALGLLKDFSFEEASIGQDVIWVDGGTVTDRHTVQNGAVAHSTDYARTGSRSLKITSNFPAGPVFNAWILTAIERQARVHAQLYLHNPDAETGTIYIGLEYCQVLDWGDQPTLIRQEYANVAVDLSTVSDWTKVELTGQFGRPPRWATHVVVHFSMLNLSAGSIYVDDVVITEY